MKSIKRIKILIVMLVMVFTNFTVTQANIIEAIIGSQCIKQLNYSLIEFKEAIASIILKRTDTTLTDLTVYGEPIAGFSNKIEAYTIELPFGTVDIPAVSATATHEKATVDIIPDESIPGDIRVKVTAEDGVTVNVYTVSFTIENAIENINRDVEYKYMNMK
ncbi:MAG TPA: hypothetical protein DEP72_06155 [Clostridiales bacterium]|nr:MAG: hypothetical protein A2Y18_01570 [Clostridiales bacterium GWD2_32_19]HCC07722.1 hypothetical protein [Clostridiales bacterium]